MDERGEISGKGSHGDRCAVNGSKELLPIQTAASLVALALSSVAMGLPLMALRSKIINVGSPI